MATRPKARFHSPPKIAGVSSRRMSCEYSPAIVGRQVQAVLEPDGDVSLPLLIDRLHAGREERKTDRFDQDFLADADRQVLPKLRDAGIERQADEPSRKRSPREASLGRFVYGKTINRRAGLFKTDEFSRLWDERFDRLDAYLQTVQTARKKGKRHGLK